MEGERNEPEPSGAAPGAGPQGWGSRYWLVAAAALVAAAGHAWWHAGFTMDDAAISYSYARSLADGLGLGVLEAGGPRVAGFSNFLWVVLLAMARRVGVDIGLTAKIAGALALAGSTWLLWWIIARTVRRPSVRWAVLLLPLSSSVALWSMSGLESGLYLLLLLGAAALLLREEVNTASWNIASAIVLVLAAMTRPDAFVFAAAALGSKVLGVLSSPGERARRLAQLAVWSAALGLGLGAYLWWHRSVFGYVFPNTVYAKDASPSAYALFHNLVDPNSPGWRYLRGWLQERGGIVLFLPALLGVPVLLRGRAHALAMLGGAALALPLFAPDWMVEHRFLVPFVAFAVCLAAAFLDALLDMASRWKGERAQLAALGLAVVAALHFLVANLGASARLRASGYAGTVSVEWVRESYASTLDGPVKALGLRRPLVALPDLGATSYFLRLRLLDLGGLADATMAHAHHDLSELQLYLFDERRPDLIHAHGPWIRYAKLDRLPGLDEDYVMVAGQQGTTPDEDSFDAVRRDVFVDRLPPGAATTPLAGGVALAMLDGPEAAAPGASLPFDVYLTAPEPRGGAIELMLDGVRADGSVAFSRRLPCGPPYYRPERWKAGERVRTRVDVPVGPERGALTIRILARAAASDEWQVRSSRPLTIDQNAAEDHASVLLASARRSAASGNVLAMERALELVEAAAPGPERWSAARAMVEAEAARAIAAKAEVCLGAEDWPCVHEALRQADRLGGVRTASPELRMLASRLLAEAEREHDPRRAYLLFRASWFANPQLANVQRGLIEARRALVEEVRRSSNRRSTASAEERLGDSVGGARD